MSDAPEAVPPPTRRGGHGPASGIFGSRETWDRMRAEVMRRRDTPDEDPVLQAFAGEGILGRLPFTVDDRVAEHRLEVRDDTGTVIHTITLDPEQPTRGSVSIMVLH